MKNNNLQFCGGLKIEQIPKQITMSFQGMHGKAYYLEKGPH